MNKGEIFFGTDDTLVGSFRQREFQRPLVNYHDPDFKGLRHLVDVKPEEAEKIARNAVEHPEYIQLLDFVDQMGLSEETREEIKRRQDVLIPEERKPFLERLKRVIEVTPSLEKKVSTARINPFTRFEEHPPVLFGMGGGSKALNKGLPIDILSMVLTAEKLRRELGLGRCRIICANGITYTNIPRNSEFSKEGIDRVLGTERDLLQLVVERFGIADHFDIFLETDIEQVIGRDLKEQYDRMIADADTVPYIGDHHYAIEMAQMYSLLNSKAGDIKMAQMNSLISHEIGGVKLGWFIRHLEKKRGGYIMDEQPFDARYTMYLAYRGLPNKTSIPYAHAGVRLYPGMKGLVNKAAPYICYEPEDRILLRPSEDPVKKLSESTQAGGGLRLKGIRRHFGSIIKLFEEVVINKREVLPTRGLDHPIERSVMVDDLLEEELGGHRADRVGKRLQYILDFIFDGNREVAEKMYQRAFPER